MQPTKLTYEELENRISVLDNEISTLKLQLFEAKQQTNHSQFKICTPLAFDIFNLISDAVISTDQNLLITDWNIAASQIYGWEKSEAIGKNIDDLLKTKFVEIEQIDAQKILNDYNFWKGDIIQINKSGETLEIIASVSSLKDEHGNFVGGITINHNVTDHRKNKQELSSAYQKVANNEVQQKALLDNALYPVILINTKGDLIYLNSAAESFFKVDRLKLKDYNVHDFWCDLNKRAELLNQIFRKGSITNFEIELYNCDKEILTVLLSAQIIDYQGEKVVFSIFNNITDSKKIYLEFLKEKEKSEENEKLLQNYLKYAPDGILVFKNDGELIEINREIELLFGYTREELFDIKKPIFVIEEEYSRIRKSVEKLIAEGRYTDEFVFKRKDNSTFYGILSSVKFSETHTISFIKNIDEIKKIQNDLIIAKEKAEENERLKTAFLQNISHEIRTPMNAIVGFSQMIGNSKISPEKQKNFLSIIVNSSNQLLSIVTDIITLSAIETNQEKLNIGEVNANEVITFLQTKYKQQINNQEISLYEKQSLPSPESIIFCDKEKLLQILNNLLSNALKFTHKGYVEFGYHVVDKTMVFYVKDTGIGIPKSLHDKIFEPFRQVDYATHRKYNGTGLGLSISKGFVKLLGGNMWLESEPEKGSTFYFSLPYNPVNTTKKTHEKPKMKMLIVEDEELNYYFLEETFIDDNFQLIHAKDGQEAVEICKTNFDISLVLMDIRLPVLGGHEAARLIKEMRKDLPIIAQTSYALNNERKHYEKYFDDYITKPLEIDILKECVYKYMKPS